MILADYPGHVAAAALLAVSLAVIILAYHSRIARHAGAWRLLLGFLQFAAVAAVVLIIWNPSKPLISETSLRNTVFAIFDTSESMSLDDGHAQDRLRRSLEAFDNVFAPGEPDGPVYVICAFDVDCVPASIHELAATGSRTDFHALITFLAARARAAPPIEAAEPSDDGSAAAIKAAGAVGMDAAAQGRVAEDASSGTASEISRKVGAGRVVGAVVFTDGQADDTDVLGYYPLRNGDFRMLFVGVGSPDAPPDVAVTAIRAPATVAVETPFQVEVDVRATGIGGAPVIVTLYEDALPADVAVVSVPDDDAPVTVTFTIAARSLGIRRLTAYAATSAVEANTANNVRHAVIRAIHAPRLRVLLYTQVASFDVGRVRSSLARDRKIDLHIGFDAFIDPERAASVGATFGNTPLPADRAGFDAWDVIILGPVEFAKLTDAQIEGLYGFVAERGGGVLFLPGRGERDLSATLDHRLRALLPAAVRPAGATGRVLLGNVELAPEAVRLGLVSANAFESDRLLTAAAFHPGAAPKPAATVVATVSGEPLIVMQRLGRGRAAFINAHGLHTWYREDLDGGVLQRVLSELTAGLGRTPAAESRIEISAARRSDDPSAVVFDATVWDEDWSPAKGATVLLEVSGVTVRMEESEAGRYAAHLTGVLEEALVARVEAERGGVFLGERVLAAALSPARSEMDRVELNRPFLIALCERLGADYVDLDELDDKAAAVFSASTPIYESGATSAWRTWPMLAAICALLTTVWFVRRALGLI